MLQFFNQTKRFLSFNKAKIVIAVFLLLLLPSLIFSFSLDIEKEAFWNKIKNAFNILSQMLASISKYISSSVASLSGNQIPQTLQPEPDFTIRAPEGGVPRWWDGRISHRDYVGFVEPVAQSGVVRIAHYAGESREGGPVIVSGTVTFNIRAYGGWSTYEFPADQLRYRHVLHTPDASGNDIRTALSDVLEGPQTISWDSTTVPDGTYAVSVELLGGGTDPDTAIDRFKRIPVTIIVDNTPGVVTGQQWLPLIGYMGQRSRWAESFAVDWVRSTDTPLSPAAHPYPYEFIAPPTTDAERQALVGSKKFFAETWLQVWNARFDQEGRLSQTKEGHRFIVGYHEGSSLPPYDTYELSHTDGQRNRASLNKHTAFRPDPTGPGFLGISYEGRLFRIHPTEGITTLAGHLTRSDVVPYAPWDRAVTTQDREANQWNIVGSFDQSTRFYRPEDLAIDPDNSNIIYIADTGNHVIRKVDLSGVQAQVTTFAGALGVSGSADGTGTAARFNSPWSVEIVGRTMYVADYGNNALRAINLETGEVTTVLDFTQITKPYWIRRFSNGDLALMEGAKTKEVIQRVDPTSGTVNKIIDAARVKPFDVDWRGVVGPVDHIITSRGHGMSRVTPEGEILAAVTDDWGGVAYTTDSGLARAGSSGTYPISLAIDDEEPRIIQTGQYQWGVHVLRPIQPDDPLQGDINLTLSNRGRDHYYAGTIREFYPNNDRPSLAALHGRNGHNYIGQLNFDDMMGWTDAQIGQYIRDGMGGGVARPELTGRDLAAMIYFIRLHSLQGKTQVIDPVQIARNLNAAGFWDDLADATSPGVSGVRVSRIDETGRNVTFTTDEPTVAAIRYGRTSNYGLTSSISDEYKTTHTIAITGLDPLYADNVHYQIRVKDQAGNQQITANALLGGGEPNNPPVVDAGSSQTITLPVNQVELQGAATDDGLPNPPGAITTTWTKQSGPGPVIFSDASALTATATFTRAGVYTLKLEATDSILTSSDTVVVTVNPESTPTLNVSLSADPDSGQAPLSSVDLTANVTGTAQGNINYTFYCNRADAGVNITTPYDAKYDNIPETTKTAEEVCDYTEPGTYTAKVIAERGALSAEARANIIVNAAPTYTYYRDRDNDSYGDPNNSITSTDLTPPLGYVSAAGDCDDNPNQCGNRCNLSTAETANLCNDGYDNDCDGKIDLEDETCQETCQDQDEDNINDYNQATCPSGRDLCVKRKRDLTREEKRQLRPISNNFELEYDQDEDDEEYDGNTEDIANLPDLKVKKANKAQIRFINRLDLIRHRQDNGCFARLDLDDGIEIDDRKVEIDSSRLEELNQPAQITFYNITAQNPIIKKDGQICSEPDCRIIQYDRTAHTLTIEVSGFSEIEIVDFSFSLSYVFYLLNSALLALLLISSLLTNFLLLYQKKQTKLRDKPKLKTRTRIRKTIAKSSLVVFILFLSIFSLFLFPAKTALAAEYIIEQGPYCGNSTCDSNEDCSSCLADCGSCGGGGGGGGGGGDITPPTIRDIISSTTSSSAFISWKTNELSLSWIEYGITTNYDSLIKTDTYSASHSINLTNLLSETTYHYRFKTKDQINNTGTYSDRTFTTLAPGAEDDLIARLQARIAEILAEIARLQALIAQLQRTEPLETIEIPDDFTFNNNLKLKDVSEEVRYLQIFLNSSADTKLQTESGQRGSKGKESIYFGQLTEDAVIRFQEKYSQDILIPINKTKGTGYFGPWTRDKANEMLNAR